MFKYIVAVLILGLLPLIGKSQPKQNPISLYTYPEQQKAYQNETRSTSGRPGKHYWQNKSTYIINAKLDTGSGQIIGTEQVKYSNNSPDSLNYIVIRTYPDFYKSTGVKDYTINKEDSSDGMKVENILVNGGTSSFTYNNYGTNIYLNLKQKLPPHKEIEIRVDWNFILPKTTHIREGRFHHNSFLVAYWYPQISVYDDVNGWDSFNYTGLQEFYNDFSDFKVSLTTNGDNFIWATGDWINPNEILKPKYLTRYKNAISSETPVQIIDSVDRTSDQITMSPGRNTFKFEAHSVSDFTFAVSSNYLWKIRNLRINNAQNHFVTLSAVYHYSNRKFENLLEPAAQTIAYLKAKLNSIKYPAQQLTIFDGDGGMEYPMIVSQGYFSDQQAGGVLAHEITHAYFPFLVGSNERRYAWMDEGFAQTLTNEMDMTIGSEKFHPQEPSQWLVDYFGKFIGSALEVPLMELSINTKGGSYYFAAYTRPAFAFDYLRKFLGDRVYFRAVTEYIDRWKYKHPTPYDFFYTLNDVTGKNLNWYWRPWFFDRGYPDLTVKKLGLVKQNLSFSIRKHGSLPVPVHVAYVYSDGTSTVLDRTAAVWENQDTIYLNVKIKKDKKLVRIEVNRSEVPDINPSDNTLDLR